MTWKCFIEKSKMIPQVKPMEYVFLLWLGLWYSNMPMDNNKQSIKNCKLYLDNPMTSKMLGWDRHSSMAQFAFLLVLCELFETNTEC